MRAIFPASREKNRTKARVTRERRKIQFKELEVALEASVVLLRTLREEFKQHTGREFHSEGIVLYAAVCEFRCSRRGGAREKACYTYSDKCVCTCGALVGGAFHRVSIDPGWNKAVWQLERTVSARRRWKSLWTAVTP